MPTLPIVAMTSTIAARVHSAQTAVVESIRPFQREMATSAENVTFSLAAVGGTGVGPRSASRAVIGAGINTAISDHRGRLPFVSGVERHQP